MTTKKFWCHYIGADGNTPKRRNIELTDISHLLKNVTNDGAKTPVWYERREQDGTVYFHLYAQLSDNVAVFIQNASMSECVAGKIGQTDAEIETRWHEFRDKLFAEYPRMSDERKSQENEYCQRNIQDDKAWRDKSLSMIAELQDYCGFLLKGDSWISVATLRAFAEAEYPEMFDLKEIRERKMAEREAEQQRRMEESRRRAEEEARRKAEEEQKEQDRLTGEADTFREGGSIAGGDVVDLCRRYGIAVHLRTVHNLQQVVIEINGKDQTCRYYRRHNSRRPQLDGCYNTARELYDYLQTH